MREAIERVIAELKVISGNAFFMMDDHDRSEFGKGVCAGRRTVAEIAINKLEEVLSHEGVRGTEHHLPTEKEK